MPRMDIAMRQGTTYPHIMPRGRPRWAGSRPWQGMPIDSAYGRYVRHAGKVSRTGGTGATGHSYYGRGAVGGGNRLTWRGGRRRPGRMNKRALCLRGTFPEKKFIDSNYSISPDVGGTRAAVVNFPQGASESQRVGRTCIMTDFLAKGHVEFSTTNTKTGSGRVRLMLVQDTQTNGVLASVLDVVTPADVNGYRTLVNGPRFKILYDKTWTSNPQSSGGDAATDFSSNHMISLRINLKLCIKFEFSGTTGDISEMTTNGLFWLGFEESAVPNSTIELHQRIRFVE